MGAVRLKTFADLRRRRLQSLGLALVLLLSTATGTLALSILVESHAPFDHAFEAANGAHLVIRYAGDVDAAELAATSTASPVTASAGPWPVAGGILGQPADGRVIPAQLSARPTPDASIDSVTIHAGRWWQAPGEAVLDEQTARLLGKQVGDTITVHASAANGPDPFGPSAGPGRGLRVVGIAGSVSTPGVQAWIAPADLAAIVPAGASEQEMLYRVTPSATAADLTAATAAITGGMPADAVLSTQTYLDLKAGVDRIADLYVPVLLAFSIFAMLAAAFLIANIVTGVVLTSYRDIGVMKAIGYTPGQVSTILAGQVLAPAIVGSVVGVVLGTIASQPLIHDTALAFGLPTAFSLSLPVVVTVLAVALATSLLAAIVPATRAGRISAVAAMTRGGAPTLRNDGGRLRRLGLALPIGLPGRLGASAGLARPARASMTLGALVVGVAAATFALGLNWSLLQVKSDLDRDAASPVRVEVIGPGEAGGKTVGPVGGAPGASPIGNGRPGQDHDRHRNPPGHGPVGHDRPARRDAPRHVRHPVRRLPGRQRLARVRPHRGSVVRRAWRGRRADRRLHAVGPPRRRPDDDQRRRAFDQGDAGGRDLRHPARERRQPRPPGLVDGSRDAPALDPAFPLGGEARHGCRRPGLPVLAPDRGRVGRLGVHRRELVRRRLVPAVPLGGDRAGSRAGRDVDRRRVQHGAAGNAPAITGGRGAQGDRPDPGPGRGHGRGDHRAGGPPRRGHRRPRRALAERLVLAYMGEVAAKTRIPAQVYDVFPLVVLVGLGLLGLGIGAVGALLPAQRAARASIAPVLQAE